MSRIGAFFLLNLLFVITVFGQDSMPISFSVDYTLNTSCTITQVTGEETYQPTIPWTGNVTYSCDTWTCAAIDIKVTDASSLTISSTAATFSPDPNGKLVHNPKLSYGSQQGPTLNLSLDSSWEDITKTLTVSTRGTVTVYAGVQSTNYLGNATVSVSCSD